jgi:hypothetical protein
MGGGRVLIYSRTKTRRTKGLMMELGSRPSN